jgi:murein DD-endopeptidase MepM/ murein hydrolase activator NlpD
MALFNMGFGVSGISDVKQMTDALQKLHTTTQQLSYASEMMGGRMSTALGGVNSPIQGIAQARTEYQNFASEMDAQRRLVGDSSKSYQSWTQDVINNAKAVGRAVTDYAAMRQELIGLGVAADTANRQISGFARSTGMGYGQATQMFGAMATSGSFSDRRSSNGAYSQVGFDAAQQAKLMVGVADAVGKSMVNGMPVTVDKILSGITSLQTQAAQMGVQGNAGGNLDIMTAMNRTGNIGLYGERGANVIEGVNQATQQGGSLNYQRLEQLRKQHPDEDYFHLQYRAEENLKPEEMKDILGGIRDQYGGKNGNQFAIAQAMKDQIPGVTSMHTAMGLMDAIDTMGQFSADDPKRTSLAKLMGNLQNGGSEYLDVGVNATNNKYVDKNGNFDFGKANNAFKDASGRNINGFDTHKAMTQDEFLTALGNEKPPEKEANAARATDSAVTNMTNSYMNAAHQFDQSIATIQQFNEKTAGASETMAAFTRRWGGDAGQNIVGGAAVGAGGLMGALQSVGTVAWGAAGAGSLGKMIAGSGLGQRLMPGAIGTFFRGAAGAAVPAAEAAAAGAVPAAAAAGAAPVAAGAAAAGGGAGILAMLAPLLAPVAALGAAALIVTKGMPAEANREKNELANQDESLKEANYQKYKKDKAEFGNGMVLHDPGYLFTNDQVQDDWKMREERDRKAGKNTQTNAPTSAGTYNEVGERIDTPSGAAGATTDPYSRTAAATEGILAESKTTNGLLQRIIDITGRGSAVATDTSFQARYGIVGRPMTYSANGSTSGLPTGGTTSTSSRPSTSGTSSAGGAGYGGGGNAANVMFGGNVPQVTSPFNDHDSQFGKDGGYGFGADYGMDGKGHTGIDYGTAAGTKVFSPVAGEVILAGGTGYYQDDSQGDKPATGELRIGIPNKDGDQLILGHLQKIYVAIGDRVRPGQLVALSGTPGGGPHVHVEYRKKNQNGGFSIVDPTSAIPNIAPSADVPGSQSGGTSAGSGTGGGSGGGGGASDGGYVPSGADNKGLTGDAIDNWIRQTRPNSPLIGYGQHILDYANKNNVSVPQALGIFLKESGLGTNVGVGNLSGLGGEGSFSNVGADWGTQIDSAIDNLGSKMYQGGSLQQQTGLWFVGDKNASTGAVDSAGGANGNVGDYVNLILKVFQQLMNGGQSVTASTVSPDLNSLLSTGAGDGTARLGLQGQGVDGSTSGGIAFEPLTVNVVFPDGRVVQSQLNLTSKDIYTNLRNFGVRPGA